MKNRGGKVKAEKRGAKAKKVTPVWKQKVSNVATELEERLRGEPGADLWVISTRLGKVYVAATPGARVWLGLSGRWLEPLRTRKFTVGANGEGLEWIGNTETTDHRP